MKISWNENYDSLDKPNEMALWGVTRCILPVKILQYIQNK